MNKFEIRAKFEELNLSNNLFAKALGVSPNYIAGVINRNHTSTRIATAIAKAMDMDVTEVFPDKPIYKQIPEEQRLEELRQKLAS